MTTKMDLSSLPAETREAVALNRRNVMLEAMIGTAAAEADDGEVSRLTVEYNRMRGLPTHLDYNDDDGDTTTDATGTTGSVEGETVDDDETDRYDEMTRPDLAAEADDRNVTAVGTGKAEYVKADDLRRALRDADASDRDADGDPVTPAWPEPTP